MFPDGLNPSTSHGLLQPFSIFLMFFFTGVTPGFSATSGNTIGDRMAGSS